MLEQSDTSSKCAGIFQAISRCEEFSVLLLELMRTEAPQMFDDFELTSLPDGSPSVYLKRG